MRTRTGSWTWAVDYMSIIIYTNPRAFTKNGLIDNYNHCILKVVGVISKVPEVHMKAGVSLLNFHISVLFNL